MAQIAKFFTLYWCIYFPTCIGFNDIDGFTYIDEVMTGVLVIFTFLKQGHWSTTHYVWQKYYIFIGILFFYTVYGLIFGRNPDGVWLDFIQELRPYSVIYCTWILNPRFSKKQKYWMLGCIIATLVAWIFAHPEQWGGSIVENPIIGQLAICAGMAWYLFTKESKENSWIALALVCSGLLAPKMKFVGEVVCFVAFIFVIKKKIDFNNPKIVIGMVMTVVMMIFLTWSKFDKYFVSAGDEVARPASYRAAFGKILWDYFPFGSGMGSFACNGAWKHYSPLYHEYRLDKVWGLDRGGGFICDAYYPSLAQFGVVGIGLFIYFWRKRFYDFRAIVDMRYYRISLMALFCILIEQTADSSILSGKGMGYCMIIGLCLNSNLNNPELEEEEDSPTDLPDGEGEAPPNLPEGEATIIAS